MNSHVSVRLMPQLYFQLKPGETTMQIRHLECFIDEIHDRLAKDGLRLNTDKTELMYSSSARPSGTFSGDIFLLAMSLSWQQSVSGTFESCCAQT